MEEKAVSLVGIFKQDVYIAKTALGKYIILSGCLLHYGWALFLALDYRAGGATPISVLIFVLFKSRWLTILILVLFSSLAMAFLSMKTGRVIRSYNFSFLLIPQLWLLLLSAGAVVYAASVGYYLDAITRPGEFVMVHRPTAFILTDQWAAIVMALLYLVAVISASRYKVRNGSL